MTINREYDWVCCTGAVIGALGTQVFLVMVGNMSRLFLTAQGAAAVALTVCCCQVALRGDDGMKGTNAALIASFLAIQIDLFVSRFSDHAAFEHEAVPIGMLAVVSILLCASLLFTGHHRGQTLVQ